MKLEIWFSIFLIDWVNNSEVLKIPSINQKINTKINPKSQSRRMKYWRETFCFQINFLKPLNDDSIVDLIPLRSPTFYRMNLFVEPGVNRK